MSHSHNIDNEVNAPNQMRDVIIWGCAAVVAAIAAISSYFTQSDFEISSYASSALQSERIDEGEPEFAMTTESSTEETDDIVTGSIKPKNSEQLRGSSSAGNSVSSFGTTVARRQPNADSIRRMEGDADPQSAPEQPVISSINEKIEGGPIGIDLGTGHSFSVLGRRYSALVNAVPTLFADLTPRAAIVEHETSIEAHLIAGPLKDIKAAQTLCKKIQLRVNTTCQPTNFSGRKLKLY